MIAGEREAAPGPQHAPPGGRASDSAVEMFRVLAALGRHRRMLLVSPIAAAILTLGITFLIPMEYTATARLMPPQQSQSSAAAFLSQVAGGLPAIASSGLGLKNPSDLYVGMLKSVTVADRLIAQFQLKQVYDKEYLVDARRSLARDTDITTDKTGIIVIQVSSRDPQRAADIANAYVEELDGLTQKLAVTEAGLRRVFLEQQLELARRNLETSEAALRHAIGTGGLVSVDAQSRATVETTARLRAQISASEIEIESMRAYAAPQYPELVRAQQEVASMRRELGRLESGMPPAVQREVRGTGGLSNIRLLRDVKYNETLFEALAKSYELARADEGRDAVVVQALDRATAPEKPSSPRRILLMAAAGVLGAMVAVGLVLIQDHIRTRGLEGDLEAALGSWGVRRRKHD